MNSRRWRIRLGAEAEADYRHAVLFSRKTFGDRQAHAYGGIIRDALASLESGPMIPGSLSRDDILPGLRSLHVARHGHRGRHIVLYRVGEGDVVEILRILHDAMDIPRHLPKA